MLHKLKNLLRDESGATAIEYAFIIALVGIALMVSLSTLADSTSTMYRFIASNVNNSM